MKDGISHKWPEDNANPQIQEGAFSPTTPDNRLKIRRIVKNHKPGALLTAAIAAEAPTNSLVVNVHFSRGDAGPEYSLLRVCCKSWPNIGHAVVASALGEGEFPFLIFELGAHASSAMVKSSNANSCFMSGPLLAN